MISVQTNAQPRQATDIAATVLREVLQKLDLRYPTGDAALAGFKVE